MLAFTVQLSATDALPALPPKLTLPDAAELFAAELELLGADDAGVDDAAPPQADAVKVALFLPTPA